MFFKKIKEKFKFPASSARWRGVVTTSGSLVKELDNKGSRVMMAGGGGSVVVLGAPGRVDEGRDFGVEDGTESLPDFGVQ